MVDKIHLEEEIVTPYIETLWNLIQTWICV